MDATNYSRRELLKSSLLGLAAWTTPAYVFSMTPEKPAQVPTIPPGYPAIRDEVTSEVVGASHFNLDRVMELVNTRPELSRATWDWGFGDWETALGAASHVGRRDIASYLISKGARPDIYTFAMMGKYEAVKAMIEAQPGIQQITGPHGFTLMHHAKVGLRSKDITLAQKAANEQLVTYLEQLGDADPLPQTIDLSAEEKEAYLGDYFFDGDPESGFSVRLNMRKLLTLGKLGSFGGALYCTAEDQFFYNGTTTVTIQFEREAGQVTSMVVKEPGMSFRCIKGS